MLRLRALTFVRHDLWPKMWRRQPFSREERIFAIFGMLAAVYTADLGKGLDFADGVRTGWVNINESSNYWEAHLPFGGRAGTDSGIGRVGGSHVMQSFTELQTVVLSPHAPRP